MVLIDRSSILTKCCLLLAISHLVTRKKRNACWSSVLAIIVTLVCTLPNFFCEVMIDGRSGSVERKEINYVNTTERKKMPSSSVFLRNSSPKKFDFVESENIKIRNVFVQFILLTCTK